MFLANDSHYLVTNGAGDRERILFGRFIPLTERAARGYLRVTQKGSGRVIKRTTARKLGLI